MPALLRAPPRAAAPTDSSTSTAEDPVDFGSNQVAIAEAAHTAGPAHARPLTPLQQFEAAYSARLNAHPDDTAERWHEFSADEEAALAARAPDPTKRPVAAGHDGYTTEVDGHHYTWDKPAADPDHQTTNRDLVGPNARQFTSRALVEADPTKKATDASREHVTVLEPDGTTQTIASNASGMAELPESGFGFTTHNRNDVVLRDGTHQPDQYGTPENVARTMNILADYRTLFPGSTLSVGDMSTDTGNSPLLDNYPSRTRHATHYNGSQTDLQYPSGTGSTNAAATSGDDLFRERTLVRRAENWGMDHFYEAPALDNKLFFGAGSHHAGEASHENHLHMGVGTGT